MPAPEVISWAYDFAPNSQKAVNLLNASGIPFKQCTQPFTLPRPILTDLGITYRRMPVNSIGKDVYCDNSIFIDAVQSVFKSQALATSAADHAYEAFGYRSFWVALPLVPHSLLSPEMLKDREPLFAVFSRPDFKDLRQNGLAEFKSLLDIVEGEFLKASGGPWIGGEKCSIADIHAVWVIKWALETLDIKTEPGLTSKEFPGVFRWIEQFPTHIEENSPEKLSAEEATKRILEAEYAVEDIGIDPEDPLDFKAGTQVSIETNDDAKPGHDPQLGKLIGLGRREIVVELENGLRLHFPRIGYVVKKAK